MLRTLLALCCLGAAPELVVRKAADAAAVDILGGKGKARVILEPALTGSTHAALDLLEVEAGAEVATHTHDASDEILHVLEGQVLTTIGTTTKASVAGDTIFIPKGAPHSARFLARTRAVQVYAPAGPEQRFKR